jgi:hypothetical protein
MNISAVIIYYATLARSRTRVYVCVLCVSVRVCACADSMCVCVCVCVCVRSCVRACISEWGRDRPMTLQMQQTDAKAIDTGATVDFYDNLPPSPYRLPPLTDFRISLS